MQQKQFASRLTLYAILSSIETDLRAYLRDYVLHSPLAADPYPPELRQKLIDRHEKYQGPEQDHLPDDFLLEYMDFSDSYELLIHHKAILSADVASELARFLPRLSKLSAVRNRVMHSRPLEPDDFSLTYDSASSALSGKTLTWTELEGTMRRLENDPSYVLTLKLPEMPWETVKAVPHNLPLPEFDDTGFIGRIKDRNDLTKLIMGHHQIVTILGEGGVGKTSILVKCLYDLLETAADRFDTIVWVSLKNQVLTAGGIKTLRDSITTTLGLYQAIAEPLGATPKDTIGEVLGELRDYLQEFRVLLAIDNLETLQHNELLDFLRDLPPTTKVVITSRIGLGELEIRRPLLPMNDAEAAQLFRRFAQVHSVESLTKLPQPDVIKICKKLHFNPLAICWFLTSVQQGTPPQELMSKQTQLLEFCVQNVYDKLNPRAILLLQILLAARKPLAEAELAYLAEMRAIDVRPHIYEIVGTMMVRVEQKKLSDNSLETQYALTEFARQFQELHHKPPANQMQQVTRKLTELSTAVETAGMYREYDPYDQRAICIRSANDRAPARLLQQALTKSWQENYAEAINLINQARDLNPTYAEIYKISALVKASSNDYLGAQEDYEQALQLSPDSPQILFFYGGFRAYKLNDSAGALELIVKAAKADPENRKIKSSHARFLTFLGRLDEAWEIFQKLISNMTADPSPIQIKTTDMAINCLHRMTEQQNGRQEFAEAWKTGGKGVKIAENAMATWPADRGFGKSMHNLLHDLTVTATALWTEDSASYLAKKLLEHKAMVAVQDHFHSTLTSLIWLCAQVNIDPQLMEQLKDLAGQYGVDVAETRLMGTVCRIFPHRQFGFMRSDSNGVEYYFRYNQLSPAVAWKDVQIGSRFSFCLGQNQQGTCAVSIGPIDT